MVQRHERGDPHCQNLVGYSYDLGLGVKRNIKLALFWYRQAAKNNDIEGLFNLALLYEKVVYCDGEGVRKNIRCAQAWLGKAAQQGHKKAAAKLEKILRTK